ncbi:MAG: hypothetical protein NW217_09730 [Hyphomicrobiaceae bacterium]|nr:hypothetical protein [Hyphomicrobiaceae bacterium]
MLAHRIKLLAILVAALPFAPSAGDFMLFNGILDVFIALSVLLILSVVLLWPDSRGAEDRIAHSTQRGSWADRVDIEAMASERAKAD